MLINSTLPKPRPAAAIRTGEKSTSDFGLGSVLDTFRTASSEVDKRPILAHALTAAASTARSFKAFPSFVYPSVYNATGVEQQQILDGLDRLPLHHASDIKAIEVVALIPNSDPGYVTNGRAFDFHGTNHVELSRKELSNPDKWLRTQLHEAGHAVDYETQTFKLFGGRSSRNPFGEGPYISDYATTNAKEDFAESYEEFFADPENLKAKAPDKYEAIKELTKPSWLESMIDRKEFRETGKYLSDVIGPNKPTRHALEVGNYASSILQISHGVSQWARSAETGDSLAHASGILNTVSGALFFTGMTPLAGMAVQGANQALQTAVKRESLGAEEVESTVAFLARPVEALFGREKSEIKEDHRPTKVVAVAAGGAIGGTVGALVGPYAGVMAGYHVAGGLGGSIGMVAGGLVGFLAGSQVGGMLGGGLVEEFTEKKGQSSDFVQSLK